MASARISAALCLVLLLCSSCVQVRVAAKAAPTHLYGSGGTTVERVMQLLVTYLNPRYNILLIYSAIGSGLGRYQLIHNIAQFIESDVPLSVAEESQLRRDVVFHLPLALQTISVFVYIPSTYNTLYLNAHVLAQIFQGTIKTWDHPEIRGLNPHFSVHRGQRIFVVHRKDSSGTTQLFTRWLQVTEPKLWKLGSAGTVAWPSNFISAVGSDGVAAAMRSNPYSIGYIGSSVGRYLGLNEAHINNRAGSFLSSAQADAYAAVPRTLPRANQAWSGVTLINAAGRLTWPISSFAYLLARQNNVRVGARGGVLKSFLRYCMSASGQRLAAANDFVELPSKVVLQNRAAIATLILARGVKVPF